MAGNLDMMIKSDLQDINLKLKEFPESEVDVALHKTISAMSQSISKKRTFTLSQERELSQLQKEVDSLEKEISEKERKLKSRNSVKSENDQGLPEKRKLQTLEEIHEEIGRIEEKIEMMEKLTGYSFLKNECEILVEDNNFIQKQYTIQGLCSEIKFNLEFEVEEKILTEGDGKVEPVAEITNLTIYVPDEVFKELHSGLERVVTDKSLHGFFRLLEPYSRWHQHRQDTFDHIHQIYPDLTSIVEQDCVPCLLLQNPKHQNGPVFAIKWSFNVDELYRTQPCLELGVQAPEELFKHDSSKVLKTAPDNFQIMLKELGVERAIDSLIQLIRNV